VRETAVIEAVTSIHLRGAGGLFAEGLDGEVLAASGSMPARRPDLKRWRLINERIRNPEGDVTIAIVGKYTGMKDAYKSLMRRSATAASPTR